MPGQASPCSSVTDELQQTPGLDSNSCTHLSVFICLLLSYDGDHKYEVVASGRLGRSETYQEQYVFVYR